MESLALNSSTFIIHRFSSAHLFDSLTPAVMQIETRLKAEQALNLVAADGDVFGQLINRRPTDGRFLPGETQSIFQQSGDETHGARGKMKLRLFLSECGGDGGEYLSHRMNAAIGDIKDLADGLRLFSRRDGSGANIFRVNQRATITAVAD